MLVRGRVAHALEARRDELLHAARVSNDALAVYREALDSLARSSKSHVDDALGGVPWPGARPTEELNAGLVRPFNHTWAHAQEARAWALHTLQGIATAAVDGSQIVANKEYGVPLSLVQVAWFRNPHDGAAPYEKDVRNLVVPPEDDAGEGEEYASAASAVNRCRFVAEMEAAGEQVHALSGAPGPPIVFFDGTFVLSFAGSIPREARGGYLDALFRLLDLSKQHRVPVVGYVDLSYAADLVTLLRDAFDLPPAALSDGQVLDARLAPLDRTAAFTAARGDILPFYRQPLHDYSADVSFLYLQTGRDRRPARLDVPTWVLEDGILDHLVDIVRAEIVVGTGYPYALEAADVTAVLTVEDRMEFFRLYSQFAEEIGLPVAPQGKSLSKRRRR